VRRPLRRLLDERELRVQPEGMTARREMRLRPQRATEMCGTCALDGNRSCLQNEQEVSAARAL